MTNEELALILRRELAPLQRDLAAMAPQVAGIPLIHRAVEALRHDSRQIRAAINDLAAVQMTKGEAEALHADVDKALTKDDELEARLSVLERQIRELQERR